MVLQPFHDALIGTNPSFAALILRSLDRSILAFFERVTLEQSVAHILK